MSLPHLTTVADFRKLPKGGHFAYELHYGEVVPVPRPKARHWKLRAHLLDLLTPKLESFGDLTIEMPFRPLAEFDFRAADVGGLSRARWDAIDPDSDLFGAPELVIKIESPSSTLKQLREFVTLCLAKGALQCWIVDPWKKSVTVIQRDGSTTTYNAGDEVPLIAFGSDYLTVDEIFAD